MFGQDGTAALALPTGPLDGTAIGLRPVIRCLSGSSDAVNLLLGVEIVAMASDQFEQRVSLWLEDKPSRLRKIVDQIVARRHFLPWPSITFLSATQLLITIAIPASAPLLFHYVYKSISFQKALVAACVLAGLQVLDKIVRYLREQKKKKFDVSEEEIWVRVGDLVQSTSPPDKSRSQSDEIIKACLGIIESYAALITSAERSQVAVSIVLYAGSQDRMEIRHRNPGNTRPCPRQFGQLDRILGHRACQSGRDPRIINDI